MGGIDLTWFSKVEDNKTQEADASLTSVNQAATTSESVEDG